jgi:hypothetical protein
MSFHPIYITTGTTTDQMLIDTLGKENMEGAIGLSRTAPWMLDQPKDLVTYRQAMTASGLPVGATTLLGWTSGRITEAALRRIQGDITPATLTQALRGLKGQTLAGLAAPLGFGSSASEPNVGSKCFWPLVVVNGTWTPAKTGQVCLP